MALSLAGCELPFGKKGGQPQGQGQMPPPLVSVVELKAKDVTWPQEFQATAAGSRAVDVRARVQGIIQKRLYKEGDFIKAGELMFQLERDTYEAVYEQAVAAWRNAEREWKRVKPLYAANAVSQKERDQALSNYESTSAAVRQAKINLDYCQVVAPVSGFTSKEASTEGNLVSPNSLLTTVNQTDPMYIEFSIAASDRMLRQQLERQGRLRFPAGQVYKARLRLLDGRMYEGEGKVDFIDSEEDDWVNFDAVIKSSNSITVMQEGYDPRVIRFEDTVAMPFGRIVVHPTWFMSASWIGQSLHVERRDLNAVADHYRAAMQVMRDDDMNTIINIVL
ncbi:MAG: efflux RND transporter periplasmic adaptor subunit, partial [Desulfovibrio sp.]|nr:efflux RND transporter periplasmic adaptor subunit [Desulfovibrio sp.]